MDTKTVATMALTVAERNVIKAAGELEKRNISNFMLVACLDRAKVMHGLEPVYENGEKPTTEE